MIKLIIQITKIIITTILGFLMFSCGNFNSISGNGNVVTTNRNVPNFTSIEAKTGLEVILEQSNVTNVKVEADDNLQEHIFTEVENGVLKIYCDANFYKSDARKVYVKSPVYNGIYASSGASIESQNTIKSQNLAVESNSGSEITLKVETQKLFCDSSSGSNIELAGTATNLETVSSSGSTINLSDLIAQNVQANSSSGSSTSVHAIEKLSADASSGSSIEYRETPKEISKNESSGGSVSQE